MVAIFLALVGRLWYLQIAKGQELLEQSRRNSRRLIRVTAPRGLVLDRNGQTLASSRPQFIVTAVPERLRGHAEAKKRLASVLQMTPRDLDSILLESRRPAAGAPVRIAVDVPMEVVAKIKEQADLLPGVEVGLEQIRYYAGGSICCHLFGHLGEINAEEMERMPDYPMGAFVGKAGIEKRYEGELRGTDGGKLVEVDAAGRLRKVLGNVPPVAGKTLVLGIDKEVQKAAEEAMRGLTGAAVAVDPRSGEVLAMVSKPDFDPNLFAKGVRPSDWRRIVTNKRHPLQNRAIGSRYPPGSTFKIITMTAGLRYGKIRPRMRVSCGGVFHLGRKAFRCWSRHGAVDPIRAVAMSCDVFFYTVGRAVGIGRLAEVAREYGVDEPSGIDLPGESKGTVPDEDWKRRRFRQPWYGGDTVNCSIGQGFVQATPLRMALVAAAVANGGTIYRPYVVKEIRSPEGKVVFQARPTPVHRVAFAPNDLQMVREGLRAAVTSGTGRAADIPGVAVCGKTGSAEDPPRRMPHAWFVCFAPMENPTIAICVFAEQGGHGGTTSAPVARRMMEAWFRRTPTQAQSAGRTD